MQHEKPFTLLFLLLILCTALFALLFRFSAMSVLAQVFSAPERPALQIAGGLAVQEEEKVTVPISYKANGAEVVAMAFAIDFDESCLSFDLTDADGDGRPDAAKFHAPSNYSAVVMVDVTDTDSEIDVIIADFFAPFTPLLDTPQLAEFTFDAICKPSPGGVVPATVAFSTEPLPSFSGTVGNPIVGNALGSVVTVLSKIPPTPTPTSTPTATPTPSQTPTPTLTPFLPPTPTATPTFVPTAAPKTLVSRFTANVEVDGVLLQWETSQEVNTRTYKIRRLTLGQSGSFIPLSGERLSKGTQGGTYTYFDNTADADHHYAYLLIEEKQSGVLLPYYELVATVRAVVDPKLNYRILLPFILR